mmetsp:Transcript_18743/g.25890  ORF Transcript_18743/g.25890 Transcript_18743/m.25890 type:complete len:280 (+) Transcript_18743:48-887(+)
MSITILAMSLSDAQKPHAPRNSHNEGNEEGKHNVRIGRVGGSNLPQEYELARFVELVENPHPTWNVSTPACEWKGVTCEDGLHVTKIDWENVAELNSLSGSIQWEWLPQKILVVDVAKQKLSGNVPLKTLPSKLRVLNLVLNQFSGGLDLQFLPNTLEKVWVDYNNFQDGVDLTQLSQSLLALTLSSNKLSGHVDLVSLPSGMTCLNLSRNLFTGPVQLRRLPATLKALYLNNNHFTGLARLDNLPESLEVLWMHDNDELASEGNPLDIDHTLALSITL